MKTPPPLIFNFLSRTERFLYCGNDDSPEIEFAKQCVLDRVDLTYSEKQKQIQVYSPTFEINHAASSYQKAKAKVTKSRRSRASEVIWLTPPL